jgi:hypothetical protein
MNTKIYNIADNLYYLSLPLEIRQKKIFNEKQLIENLITASTSKLQVDAFIRLYNEDGLKHLIKDTSFWLRDTFKVLNSFNK